MENEKLSARFKKLEEHNNLKNKRKEIKTILKDLEKKKIIEQINISQGYKTNKHIHNVL